MSGLRSGLATIAQDARCRKVATRAPPRALACQRARPQRRQGDAERKATEIRLRAERKAGELLAKMERTSKTAAGAKGNKAQGKNAPATVAAASTYQGALESAGVNERTARRWQELAGVPQAALLSLAGKRAFVTATARQRRNMSPDQKRELLERQKGIAAELKAEKRSQEQIAVMLGVARETVRNWLIPNGREAKAHNDPSQRPRCRAVSPQTRRFAGFLGSPIATSAGAGEECDRETC